MDIKMMEFNVVESLPIYILLLFAFFLMNIYLMNQRYTVACYILLISLQCIALLDNFKSILQTTLLYISLHAVK